MDDLVFDLQEKLTEMWVEQHPGGKLPDKIGWLLSEIRREWYKNFGTREEA